jgi:hypothetical protein
MFVVLEFVHPPSRNRRYHGAARWFWMVQMARRLTDAVNGLLIGKRFLIHDREPLFTTDVRATLAATGVNGIRLPPRARPAYESKWGKTPCRFLSRVKHRDLRLIRDLCGPSPSREFAASDRVCRFLRLAVTETLEGRSGDLKKYRFGVEVFDRQASS